MPDQTFFIHKKNHITALNFNTFHLIFQKLKEIKVNFKLQKCAAYQDLPTLQF